MSDEQGKQLAEQLLEWLNDGGELRITLTVGDTSATIRSCNEIYFQNGKVCIDCE